MTRRVVRVWRNVRSAGNWCVPPVLPSAPSAAAGCARPAARMKNVPVSRKGKPMIAKTNPSPPKSQSGRKPPWRRRGPSVLRFSPTAWAKLLFFRDQGQTEIGGFGVTPAEDLLYVRDFMTIRQSATSASISFDDQAVADFFDRQVDAGLQPVQFGRIWLHTHPGSCPTPSSTDEETFDRVFGGCQHAIMFILAQGGQSYARLRFNVEPGGQVVIPVEIDYGRPFEGSDLQAWKQEYEANIRPGAHCLDPFLVGQERGISQDMGNGLIPQDWLEELREMEPAERQMILDELGQGDAWHEEVGYGR